MPTLNQLITKSLTKNPIFTGVLFSWVFYYGWEKNYAKISYVCLIFLFVLLLEYVKSFPTVKQKLEELAEDDKTIQAHWVRDKDLIIATWVCRCLYVCAFIFYSLIPVFIQSLPVGAMLSPDISDMIRPFLSQLLFLGHTCVFMATLLHIGFGVHIVNFRNTPTKHFILKTCEICAKFGAVGLGAATFGAIGMSFIPGSEVTTIGNVIHKYVPGIGRGYAFEHGQQSLQDSYLKLVPGYRSEDMIGDNLTMSQEKVETFVSNNQALIRKELCTVGCEAVGLTKSAWGPF